MIADRARPDGHHAQRQYPAKRWRFAARHGSSERAPDRYRGRHPSHLCSTDRTAAIGNIESSKVFMKLLRRFGACSSRSTIFGIVFGSFYYPQPPPVRFSSRFDGRTFIRGTGGQPHPTACCVKRSSRSRAMEKRRSRIVADRLCGHQLRQSGVDVRAGLSLRSAAACHGPVRATLVVKFVSMLVAARLRGSRCRHKPHPPSIRRLVWADDDTGRRGLLRNERLRVCHMSSSAQIANGVDLGRLVCSAALRVSAAANPA